MARGVWSGPISFGLLNVPVTLVPARRTPPLSFMLVDKRDGAPVGYKRYNKETQAPVPQAEVAKGFEYKPRKRVVLSGQDFKRASPKEARSIAIQSFALESEIDPIYWKRPYFLIPGKHAFKGYELLRRTLAATKKAAVSRILMRDKSDLCAVIARGRYLILETLRYAETMHDPDGDELLEGLDADDAWVSDRELRMAERLVDRMTEKWDPLRHRDRYKDDLMKVIREKARGLKGERFHESLLDEAASTEASDPDFAPLLERSLEEKPGARS